jgi:hypothetical protein
VARSGRRRRCRSAAHSAALDGRNTTLRRMRRGEARTAFPSRRDLQQRCGGADVAVAEVDRGGALIDVERQRERPFQPVEIWERTNSAGDSRLMAARAYAPSTVRRSFARKPATGRASAARTAETGSAGRVMALGVRGENLASISSLSERSHFGVAVTPICRPAGFSERRLSALRHQRVEPLRQSCEGGDFIPYRRGTWATRTGRTRWQRRRKVSSATVPTALRACPIPR